MASISETLVNSALTQATGDQAAKGVESIAQLGEHIQNVQLRKQQIEQAKLQVQNAKLDKFVDALDKGRKFTGTARTNYYKNFLPKLRDGMGLTEMFPDDSLQFAVSNDQNLARLGALKSRVQRGEITGEQAIRIAMDPAQFADVLPEMPENIFGAAPADAVNEFLDVEKTAEANKAQMGRLEKQIKAREDAATTEFVRAPVLAQKKEAIKSFDDFKKEGGTATVERNIQALESALAEIGQAKVKLGGLGTSAASFFGDKAVDIADPKVAALRDKIFSATSGTLRAINGPQFTQQEAERTLSLSFNPRMSNDEAVKKLRPMIQQLRKQTAEKLDYFAQQGLLAPAQIPKGFRQEGTSSAQSQGAAATQQVIVNIQKYLQQNPQATDEQLVQMLSARIKDRATALKLIQQAKGGK